MSDIKFVDGLIVKAPNDKAPDFVKCAISIKRKELGNWLRGETEDWINIDVKVAKSGKWYAAVNNWRPNEQSSTPAADSQNQTAPTGDFVDDDLSDIPF